MPATATDRKRRHVFTITFHIEGYDYRVFPLAAEAPQKAYRLKKPDGETYDVLLNEEGQYSCECLGFLRHGMCRDGRGCKHIRCLVAAGMLPPPPPPPAPRRPAPAAEACEREEVPAAVVAKE
jgi:hypothetical protein